MTTNNVNVSNSFKEEYLILKWLCLNWKFSSKVLFFIKEEYFLEYHHTILFHLLHTFVGKYNVLPSKTILIKELGEFPKIRQDVYAKAIDTISSIFSDVYEEDFEWIIDTTEKWCQERALFLAVFQSIEIIEGKNKTLNKGSIPSLLQNALAVSFDTDIGLDYFENIERRLNNIETDFDKIPFELEYLNLITDGGLPTKTLTCIMGATNVGKSLGMCSLASSFVKAGNSVLYISGELSEDQLSNRIDGSMMNIDINSIKSMNPEYYKNMIDTIKEKTIGKLIIKEYPTTTAHSGHIRALLEELKIKKNFRPNIIMVDYLNCFLSSRFKIRSTNDSYAYIKAIAEELRGIAVEYDTRVITGTQLNREGTKKGKTSITDVEITDTAESWGLPQVVDLMLVLLSNEDLLKKNQILIKQLKNRLFYSDRNPFGLIGIAKGKQMLYNLSTSGEQATINESNIKAQNYSINDDDDNTFDPFN
jgi:replicative DNA helicase